MEKTLKLARGTPYEDKIKEIAKYIWSLENLGDIRELFIF